MEAFKNRFDLAMIKRFALEIKRVDKSFNEANFVRKAKKNLKNLEMKERTRQIARVMDEVFQKSYVENLKILEKTNLSHFDSFPIFQYIEDFGIEFFDESLESMGNLTNRLSAEFAIRPYLIKDKKKVFKYLKKWAKSKDVHKRRLASEGIRPNLPWGMKVQSIHDDLKFNLQILSQLKDDPEVYVQKSVANHLNDFSHLNPKLLIDILKEWKKNETVQRSWIIRHASRNLFKKGNHGALKLHGYDPKVKLDLNHFKLSQKKIREGDSIEVAFQLENKKNKEEKVLIDYIIYYLKSNGSYSQKVFRLKDTKILKNENLNLKKKISFKKVTTRKHYSGKHFIEIQVNSQRLVKKPFDFKI